jgi:flagellar hook-associated protein 3 FlgL
VVNGVLEYADKAGTGIGSNSNLSVYKNAGGTITSDAIDPVTLANNTAYTLNSADVQSLQDELNNVATPPSGTRQTEINSILAKAIPLTQINSDLKVDISEGVKTTYNKTAVNVLEFKDKSGTSINVSDLFATIIKNLGTTGNTSDLTTTNLKDIQSVTANLLQQRSEVGSFQNRMDSAQTNNDNQNYNLTDILSKTEDIDFADKTMEYSMMQTVYTASLQTSAKILPMTILTYL